MTKLIKTAMPTVIVAALVAACVSFIISTINEYNETPVVQTSNTTQLCVKVIPASAGSCANLPEKYSHVWIK